jgi:hypothetical protein
MMQPVLEHPISVDIDDLYAALDPQNGHGFNSGFISVLLD